MGRSQGRSPPFFFFKGPTEGPLGSVPGRPAEQEQWECWAVCVCVCVWHTHAHAKGEAEGWHSACKAEKTEDAEDTGYESPRGQTRLYPSLLAS